MFYFNNLAQNNITSRDSELERLIPVSNLDYDNYPSISDSKEDESNIASKSLESESQNYVQKILAQQNQAYNHQQSPKKSSSEGTIPDLPAKQSTPFYHQTTKGRNTFSTKSNKNTNTTDNTFITANFSPIRPQRLSFSENVSISLQNERAKNNGNVPLIRINKYDNQESRFSETPVSNPFSYSLHTNNQDGD